MPTLDAVRGRQERWSMLMESRLLTSMACSFDIDLDPDESLFLNLAGSSFFTSFLSEILLRFSFFSFCLNF